MAMRGEWTTLLAEAHVAHLRTPHQAATPHSKKRRAKKAFLAGEFTKTCAILSSYSNPTAPSHAASELLDELHPAPNIPVSPTPQEQLPASFFLDENFVHRTLQQTSKASSPGPDCMRPLVLKYLAATPGGQPPDAP
ncbi:hypothetical protein FGB62_318g07 [Gracilaria domingensis]|nr:hypothetical protein FGB62_318g07 [Gracilaria domingensis]